MARPSTSSNIDVVTCQPVSIIDHVCPVKLNTILEIIQGEEPGGSRKVVEDEIQHILSAVGEYYSKAGGSASNLLRSLHRLGSSCKVIGARGNDEMGQLFENGLKKSGIDVSDLKVKDGRTGRCCILVCTDDAERERTMRTWLEGAAAMKASELEKRHVESAKIFFLSSYCFYQQGLVDRIVKLCQESSCKIAIDLASFEVVRRFFGDMKRLLESGAIDVCFCNEDEATEVAKCAEIGDCASDGLEYLSLHAKVSIVTLGAYGSMLKRKGQSRVIFHGACRDINVVDTTGAGDSFAAGFLHSMNRNEPDEEALRLGTLLGAAVVQGLGAEISEEGWTWLIQKLGKGPVYVGDKYTSDVDKNMLHQVSRVTSAVGKVLGKNGNTNWLSGYDGPFMQAVHQQCLQQGLSCATIPLGCVGCVDESVKSDAVVSENDIARNVALLHCGKRSSRNDRTAYIFLPGGFGTMYNLFWLLRQLENHTDDPAPCPVILCNFDGFFDGIASFLDTCKNQGVAAKSVADRVFVCSTEDDVVQALTKFYSL